MNTSKRALILIGLVVTIMQLHAQNDALREQIESITAKAMLAPESHSTIRPNGTR